MFVLDTNVLSELTRLVPEPAVVNWISRQSQRVLYTTSITEAEIFFGIALMPSGRRREAYAATAERMFAEDFAGRVLVFDRPAARYYAEVAAERRRLGLACGAADLQIAAIAGVSEATIVTRNVTDFQHCGIAILNPWAANP